MRFWISDMIGDEQAVQLAARYPGLGIESIRFSIGTVLEQGTVEVESFRQELGEYGGELSLHGPFLDMHPASYDPGIREVTRSRFEQAYDAAVKLGVSHLVYHTGWLPDPYGFGDWLEEAERFWRAFLEGKDAGIQLHIENVFERDWRPLAALIDRLECPFVTACLDVGHVSAGGETPVQEWIRGLNTRIGHVHLHNNDGIRDRHRGLTQGKLDVREILHLLAEQAPAAGGVLELPAEEDMLKSLDWLIQEGWLRARADGV